MSAIIRQMPRPLPGVGQRIASKTPLSVSPRAVTSGFSPSAVLRCFPATSPATPTMVL